MRAIWPFCLCAGRDLVLLSLADFVHILASFLGCAGQGAGQAVGIELARQQAV